MVQYRKTSTQETLPMKSYTISLKHQILFYLIIKANTLFGQEIP